MAGYDLVHTHQKGYLTKEKLKKVVEVLEQIAGGKTLRQLHNEGVVDYRAFYKIVVEFPEVAKAFAVAREMSGYSMEDMALDEAQKLAGQNDWNGTKVKAVATAMEQWRWSAARRNAKEFGSNSTQSLVVPIQINTSLDIGQPGAKTAALQDNVYEFAAQVKADAVDVEAEPVYTPPDEPVPGAAKFGITDPPKSALPKKPAGRPPGNGHHKTPAQIASTKTAYSKRKPRNGGNSGE